MITEYRRPRNVAEAVALKGDGFVFLAGGTQINNAGARRLQTSGQDHIRIASLDALDLSGISFDAAGDGRWIIGAGTTLQELADNGEIPRSLCDAASFIPTRSVRNIATIGGNIGAKRSDSYIIPVLLALDAVAETSEGSMPVEEYVSGDHDALILRVVVPPVRGVCRAVKESRSHIALPVVSGAVRVENEGNTIVAARVALGCVAPRPVRLPAVEEYLKTVDPEARDRSGAIRRVEELIAGAIRPEGDFLGSVEYKRYVNSVVVADCVQRCIEEVLS